MYYLLNFYDHTFATMETEDEVFATLGQAQTDGQDLSYYEVVNCCDESIRTDGQSFFSEHFQKVMSVITES